MGFEDLPEIIRIFWQYCSVSFLIIIIVIIYDLYEELSWDFGRTFLIPSSLSFFDLSLSLFCWLWLLRGHHPIPWYVIPVRSTWEVDAWINWPKRALCIWLICCIVIIIFLFLFAVLLIQDWNTSFLYSLKWLRLGAHYHLSFIWDIKARLLTLYTPIS